MTSISWLTAGSIVTRLTIAIFTPVTIHTFTFSYMEFRDGYMDNAEANTHARDLLKKAGYSDKKIHGLLEIKEPTP